MHADLFHYFIPGTSQDGLKRFQRDLANRLGKLGLTEKETIVVYESRFGMRAARVAWMLEYAGASRVFLLEGGFQEWEKARFPVGKRLNSPEPSVFHVRPVPRLLATAQQVLSSRSGTILDVRSSGEFKGTEGRECDTRKGRIPRAKWLEWKSFVQNGDKFKAPSQIGNILYQKGLNKNKEVITYCHRGARAAAAYYALRSLGYRNVRNYIGSWHEWSAWRELPIERDWHA